MKIEIEIAKEFEEHFNQDKFKDSFERIMADIKYSLKNGDCLCAGRYEYETIEMLEKAFENSKPAYEPSEDKIKVTSLEVIVTGSKTKPYYEIKYKEVGADHYSIGYSSYNLDFILDWKEKCFELIKVVE